jgi:hypothetical protein
MLGGASISGSHIGAEFAFSGRTGQLEKTYNWRRRPREESNLRTQLRRLPLCPLSYGAVAGIER